MQYIHKKRTPAKVPMLFQKARIHIISLEIAKDSTWALFLVLRWEDNDCESVSSGKALNGRCKLGGSRSVCLLQIHFFLWIEGHSLQDRNADVKFKTEICVLVKRNPIDSLSYVDCWGPGRPRRVEKGAFSLEVQQEKGLLISQLERRKSHFG